MAVRLMGGDRFGFGLWMVGWRGRDRFGDVVWGAVDAVEAGHRLAGVGVYGVRLRVDGDRSVRRCAVGGVAGNVDVAAWLGAPPFVCWGGRAGAAADGVRGIRAALDRYRQGRRRAGLRVGPAQPGGAGLSDGRALSGRRAR